MEGDASDDDASDEGEVFNIDGFLDIAKFDMNNIRSVMWEGINLLIWN